MNLFVYILVGYSITSFLVESVMFTPSRTYLMENSDFLKKMLVCMYCTGFWVGCFLHLLWSPVQEYFCSGLWLINLVCDGFFIAATTWFLYRIDNKLE